MSREARSTLVVALSVASLTALGVIQSSSAVSATLGSDGTNSATVAVQAREDALALVARRISAVAQTDGGLGDALPLTATGTAGEVDADASVLARQAAVGETQQLVIAEQERVESFGDFYFPTIGQVGSRFGMRFHPILHIWRMHEGVDIGAACNTPIESVLPGTVISAGAAGDAGNRVQVDHGMVGGKHLVTNYLHMNKIEVSVGDTVGRAEQIGLVGSTGLSTECHLHFEVVSNGTKVDPAPYLNA